MESTEPHRHAPRKPSEVVPGRLRELRRSRGWSQRHLAELLKAFGLKVKQPAIPLMEREPSDERPSRKASLDEVVALASIFGVPLEYLYDDAYGTERSWVAHQVKQAERSPEDIRTEDAEREAVRQESAQPKGEE